jgi:hypothetical protein
MLKNHISAKIREALQYEPTPGEVPRNFRGNTI